MGNKFREIISNLGFRNQKSPDGRLRTSNQISLGGYKQSHSDLSEQFDTEIIGTATSVYESTITGGTTMTVTSALDAVVRETFQSHNYFPGKPQKIELTNSGFEPQVGVGKIMGYYSSTTVTPFATGLDGLLFRTDDTKVYCEIYRAGTLLWSLPQESWLNQDELTNWDPSLFNFYVIDFLYLGGAVANFWVLTEHGLTLVASYQHINQDASTFIKSPNQPVRYEIRSTGGVGRFNHICSDVASEGQLSAISLPKSYDTNSTGLAAMVAGTRYALLGVQLKHAVDIIELYAMSVLSDSNDNFLIQIFMGGTTVGVPIYNDIPGTMVKGFAGYELGVIANAIHSGGTPIYAEYVASTGTATTAATASRRIGHSIDGTPETAFLCVTPLSAAGSAFGAINWREFL